ncbi:hypothetical protein DPMN_120195 [Dreissena polymorpha]|uniref:Uncharacterized protein n=1 Tax=Dreissena polymorpha TaxID=45954 RepID=A0A9D4GN33_DREPO|nr:hypothetical protein DPMN_120195 [Dreissena polymorpha]
MDVYNVSLLIFSNIFPGIPQVVLLNKVDLTCRKEAANVGNVFKSPSIQEVVEKVSTMFGLQFNNIFPVKNYVSEMELDVDTSILALLALRQILYLTEDYIEGLQEKVKRVKVSSVKNKQPSEKTNEKNLYDECVHKRSVDF